MKSGKNGLDNLIRLLQKRVSATEAPSYLFLADGEVESERLSFADLDLRARSIGARLQELDLRGERVLLLYPPGLGFVEAFFGCLYAGAVAVPAYPPRPRRDDPRLRAIVRDARPRTALTTTALRDRAGSALAELAGIDLLTTDGLDRALAARWQEPDLGADSLAFLQYTSGSTAEPKGVMVSHGNLLDNQEIIRRSFRQTAESVIVGWLPLYHDMGLIGNVLQPLYAGGRCILMSPLAFLQQPRRWLAAISRYRATTSGGPNFAYELCLRKIADEQLEGLDLSSWSVAFNGAEPVRAETLDGFARRFRPCGFRPAAFYPCYGLAEATLFVAGGTAGAGAAVRAFTKEGLAADRAAGGAPGDPACRSLVGCGAPQTGHRLLIVDPDARTACPDGRIGEVWVRGPSVARGYWNRPAETAESFGARLSGAGPEPFLRTGDLGFVLDGELFLTGRRKDLIIVRGRNHYPQDLERTAEASHPALRAGCSAAFAVEGVAGEELVLVCEVERGREAEAATAGEAVLRAIAEEHEVAALEVVLVPRGEVPKTSSGKLRRSACRADYLGGRLRAVARAGAPRDLAGDVADREPAPAWAALAGRSPEERRQGLRDLLRRELARASRLPPSRIDPALPVTALGLDSLALAETQQALEEALGQPVAFADLLEAGSLDGLADLLLAQLQAGAAVPRQRLEPMAPAAEHPLSIGQEALWFLDRLAPGNPAYLLAGAARLRGPLAPGALRAAFAALVERHAPLRTVLAAGPDAPVQRVLPPAALSGGWFAGEDASSWSAAALRARLDAEAGAPFDLGLEPPLRVRCYRLGPDERVVLVALHHTAADLWSIGVLLDELGSLLAGQALPPLPLCYADYVHWQRAHLAGPAGERLWQHWRAELAGELPPLGLLPDRPRPAVQTFAGAARLLRLGARHEARLASLAARLRSTPYMVLLTAFSSLLWRWGGGDDLLVGSPAACRGAAGLAGLVGYFVNPLVLRIRIGGDPQFAALAAGVRRTVLAAFAHQDYPFPLLAQRLQPERDPARHPLFQALFALQETPRRGAELAAFALGVEGVETVVGGLRAEPVRVEPRGALCDLSLFTARVAGELVAALEYNVELWDAATAERLLRHFATLLDGALDDPAARLADLPLMAPGERQQLLDRAWSGGAEEAPPPEGTLHGLFAAQVARTPRAEALVCGRDRLSYAELDARASRLARELAALGVGPEVPVAVSLPRSADLVVSILAVLMAGGAYVPLDPSYPAERRAFQLADSGARLLVQTGAAGAPGIEARAGGLPPRPVPGAAGAANLAYVLYTSGSTGRPKGVAVTHASAVALVRWAARSFDAEELSGVLAATSLAFDLSVFELFVPLALGGRVILADNVLALPALPAAGEVTLVNTVPAALRELLRSGGLPDGVRTVNLAGEPLPGELARELYRRPGVRRVLNLYGPTEDTTYSTWEPVGRAAAGEPGIGRPIDGTRAYVVDPRLRPAPVGVPGELLLGGAGLARGYLGRPDLTAERFVPDPFSGRSGERLYRTGDLVRWRADASLEFLGRIDHQVKVRGFRVEPGEVEAVLGRHPDVAECAVLARDDGAGGRLLAACLVPAGTAVPDASGLRAFLAQQLPAYMVPSAFAVLAELPRTPSGKIDRAALARSAPVRMPEAVAPASVGPAEELLCGIWCDLLGLDRVGVRDDFFALGGHSLLATRLISRVRDAFQVELALAEVFRRPTVAGLAACLGEARPAGAAPPAPPLRRVPRQGPVPCSAAQGRLWFLDRLAGGEPVYTMAGGFRVDGALAVPALRDACAEVVRRHEALRTRFPMIDGEPVQEIEAAVRADLPVVDLDGLDVAAGEAELDRLAAAAVRRPFDLATGPVLRLCLVRQAAERHAVLVMLHHIAGDGWSLDVLAREVEALYGAFASGRPSPLPELALQYADVCDWQRRWLAAGLLEAGVAAWRERLAGAPPAVELPLDRPRPAVPSFRGASAPLGWPAELGRELQSLARAENATPFLVLLAGFAALLHRLGGQEDVVVGAPFANRDRSEVEGLIGLFVNTLPLRLDLAGAPAFRVVLGRARTAALDAYAHRHLPFERLVEELAPARDLSRSPLFQVLLAVDEGMGRAPRLAGAATAPLELHTGTAKLDLTLAVSLGRGRLAGGLEYATGLFDAATARRLAGHLATLLAAAARDPGRQVDELPLLSPAEADQLLVEWAATGAPFPRDRGLHELFAAQAARTPEATALVWGRRRTSYGELARRAAAIARSLRGLGVGPEVPVAIFMDRTPDMVAALLGVLQAGGAYVPVDPAYPAERVAFLLADSAAPVLVTQDPLVRRLPPVRAEVLPVERVAEEAADGGRPLTGWCHPDQAAYVIYTSGSTGTPKGVVVRHGSAVARVTWAAAQYPPERLAGVLASTSICFDLSVFEIFVPLAAGGAAILADNVLALHGLPAAAEVTLVNTVPSAMAELVRARALPAGVRTVNLAGEPLRRELVARLHELPGDVEVYNLYGPSEDTTYSTGARMERADGRAPSLGRPLPNTRVYLLDRGLRPVPVGAAGELWLGGEGLARGYLGRPDLTADRFRPDPFATAPGGRLYRTGDAARWRPTGELEFLGRLDHQVKVRGHRVELGEVETVLAQHPGLAEVAVAAHEDEPGAGRLVAYLVPAPGEELDVGALRRQLAGRLPSYLVPADWIVLPALPRTPNGKVDRRALPAPDRARRGLPPAGAGPRTLAEELLAETWARLLRLERVGLDDNFFELGGHSLLAAQVVSRVRESLGVDLPVQAVFERPTLAALAERIEAALHAAPASRVPLLPVARDGEIPLSFSQERLWFLDQLDPGNAFYNLPVAARITGPLRPDVLRWCCAEVARRHESLRTTFADAGGRPCQVIAPPAPVALPLVDLAALPPPARERAARRGLAAEVRRPFDLARGPLLRVLLLRLAADDHLLVVTTHHVVSDGWSITVLLRELASLYAAGAAGQPSPLPPLLLQYADYALWQRRALQGDVLGAHLGYWRERLAGAPGLELPADRPRPAVERFRGAQLVLELPAGVTAELRDLGRREGVTLFMALLAAFKALLLRLTGQGDLCVGAPVANRNHPEVEGLIGFFANSVVLRTNLDDGPSFRASLQRVREVALGAYAHQDLPFEKLVEEIQPERDTSRNPLFQVMCVLQNQPWPELRMGDLELAPLEVDSGTAKFDLTLFWHQREGALRGLLEYNTDLFDGSTARRLGRHYEALLRSALADPLAPLPTLPLLSAGERHQVLLEWNDAGADADEPAATCVHHLVAAQAARTPDALAVWFDGQGLSYRELDRRAAGIARRLRRLGVARGSRVGVLARRSVAMVVGVLGVLEAGAACVPLDPSYPHERLEVMAADAALEALLSDGSARRALPGVAVPEVVLGSAPEPAEAWREPARAGAGDPDDLVYVIYTSGSTGRPKGVGLPHGALVNLLRWQRRRQGFRPRARVLQLTSLSFDVSFQEIFSTWASGGTLVLVDEEVRRDAGRLLALVAGEGIERLFVPVVALHGLAGAAEHEGLAPASLTEVIAAGEQLKVTPAVAKLFGSLPGCTLENQYGPSESHVVTAHRLRGEPGRWPALPPIGRPVANTRILLLDRGLRLVPIGVVGELYIGGANLARGYVGRPELTAERFVPDPLAARPGERLYRTGDLARLRADGTIEFLGRADHQVKIRGFRVEPGEIETVLRRSPAVRDAAVAVHAAGAVVRLVAYVVPEGEGFEAEALLAFLRPKLPEYMLPATFVPLAALPVNPNGKLDRKALPAPEGALSSRPELVPPGDALEELLAEMWARALGLPRVGIHDDFFASGGHSMLATQLISRIRGTFRFDVPLRTLFEAPTVAAMAGALVAREPRPGHCVEIAELVQSVKAMPVDRLRLELAARKTGGATR